MGILQQIEHIAISLLLSHFCYHSIIGSLFNFSLFLTPTHHLLHLFFHLLLTFATLLSTLLSFTSFSSFFSFSFSFSSFFPFSFSFSSSSILLLLFFVLLSHLLIEALLFFITHGIPILDSLVFELHFKVFISHTVRLHFSFEFGFFLLVSQCIVLSFHFVFLGLFLLWGHSFPGSKLSFHLVFHF